MKSHKILTAILVMQAVMLMGQWFGGPVMPAMAQIPDAGAQRVQVIEQLKSVNDKLDRLIALLESGKVQVQAAKPDDSQKK